MRNRFSPRVAGLVLVAGLQAAFSGCSMDVNDPNNAAEEEVLSSMEGVQALAVGVQQYYATSVLGPLLINTGVTARELTINSTFIGQVLIENGGEALDGSVGEINTLWGNLLNVMRMSELLIEQVPHLPFDAGTRSGILALANLHRAMALGHLIQIFEQAPLATDPAENATFHSRPQVLATALQHLEVAANLLRDMPPSTLFNTRIKGSKLDLLNTIHALRARFQLIAGDYQAAIDASLQVDPAAASYFVYDALNPNPIFTSLVQTRLYAPRDHMGTPVTEPGDARLTFFLLPDNTLSNPRRLPIERLAGFFTGATSPIPVYIPGEMMLVRAEAFLHQGNVTAAVQEINAIRTKTASSDPVGLGAALGPYAGAVTVPALLEEIYRQRAAELYLQGLRWEDSRRLGRPGPPASLDERNRNFWPYPDQERRNNPNTPANPAI